MKKTGKDYEIAMLLDFYGELLSERKRTVMDMYYNEDLSLAEIAAFPMILTEPGIGYRRILEEFMTRENLALEPIMEIGRTDVIVAMLERGIGVSFLPDFVTRKKVEEGTLTYLNVKGVRAQIWKQLIYHKNKWVTKSLRALIDYISEHEFGR